ncbi:hypothetical protein [Arthrobacter sp. UYCo732]|uniref:hypothetical protein n=1 Tax=Arthrobacter sp. UYCo732 TaxID=3156336 RepID=UPI003397A0A5
MASKHTRSQHFLWEQQRLREQSDGRNRSASNRDRENFYNQRDAAARRRKPAKSNQEIEAQADFVMSLGPVVWFLAKWIFAYFLGSVIVGIFGGINTVPGMVVAVIFLGLVVLKQVRRRRKRRGY